VTRTVFCGGDVVLPDRLATRHSLIVERDRVAGIVAGEPAGVAGDRVVDVSECVVAPGFVDAHVHGVAGHDVLDGVGAVERVSGVLPRFGVTAFCPTSVACSAAALDAFLGEVARLRAAGGQHARVIGAHLESSFLNHDFRGAQPAEWLRTPGDGREVLAVMDRHREAVAIVTLAPEIEGGQALVGALVGKGIRVSLGHSGATWSEAQAAFDSGAARVTHLFNRMRPLAHREPGLVGAALAREDVAVEVIGDGHHIHPAIMRTVWAAKCAARVIAITDGTAGSGLPRGSVATLGGRSVRVDDVARFDDGTIAGSVATMDQVFARWARDVGVGMVDAALMCATSPAADVGRADLGRLVPGAQADCVVLDRHLRVRETWIAGVRVYQK
jgi:N-acetylglucosamine-6-phosphate deacetylase